MEETRRLLDNLISEVHELDVSTLQVAKNQRRNRIGVIVLGICLLLTIVTLITGAVIVSRVVQYNYCVDTWGTKLTERTTLVSERGQDRQNVLDKLLRDAGDKPQDPAKMNADYNAYIRVSNAYNAAIRAYPVPKPPELACHVL